MAKASSAKKAAADVAPISGISADQMWRCIFPVARADMVNESTIREFAKRTVGERLYAPYSSETRAQDSGPITAVINTNDVDHYQTIVDPAGGKFENFLRNPIVLYQHGYDWQFGFWPAGQCQELRRSPTTIEADTLFDLEGENGLGRELDRLYRKKWMRGWSIGFMPHDYDVILKDDVYYLKYLNWELLEYSAVAVPGNQSALTKALANKELVVENKMLREYLEAFTREQSGDKTTTRVSVPDIPKTTEKKPEEKPATQAQPVRMQFDAPSKLLDMIGRRDGMKIELLMEDMPLDDAAMNKIKQFMSDMMNGKGGMMDNSESYKPEDVVEPTDEQQAEAAAIENARAFPIEWEESFNIEVEARAAIPAAFPAMAAVVAGSGEKRHAMLIHHHADGRVNWRALASCMTRLLTEPVNMTNDEKQEAYKHLRAHFMAVGVPCPDPTKMTPDEAYDFALEGRGTWRVDGYDWMFVEPVSRDGKIVGAGFQRIDDPTSLKVGPVPELGRLTDSRYWGKREAGRRALDDATVGQFASLRRELESTLLALQNRKGAEFSKKNRERITQAASQLDTTAADMERALSSIRDSATYLRSLIEKDVDGADEGDDSNDGGSRKVSDGGSGGDRSPATTSKTAAPEGDDAGRKLR